MSFLWKIYIFKCWAEREGVLSVGTAPCQSPVKASGSKNLRKRVGNKKEAPYWKVKPRDNGPASLFIGGGAVKGGPLPINNCTICLPSSSRVQSSRRGGPLLSRKT
jgi:hypothetical protein